MSVKQMLIAAKNLIVNPQNWCKGTLRRAGPIPGSYQYCAVGAIAFSLPTSTSDDSRKLRDKCIQILEIELNSMLALPNDITYYNDKSSTTHADIMVLYDRAIATQSEGDLDE